MSVAKTREFEYAFALNKQSNIGTAVNTAQLTRKLPQRGFAPFFTDPQTIISDRNWYGKGHNHATFYDQMSKLVRIPSREFSMTQLSALFAPAFVLGDLSSSQPDSAAPSVYDHVFTFQDPTTNPDCLFTSMIEKAADEYQELLSGVVINSFNIVGNRNDHVVIGYEGFARTKAANVTSLPALATLQSYFKILKAAFTFGAAGGGSVISTQVLGFNLQVSQNADIATGWLPGATEGEEHLLSRVLIGDQVVTGSLMVFLDATLRAFFEDQDECELEIVLTGDTITGAHKHRVTIEIPHFKIATAQFSEEGQTTMMTLAFDENSVLKHATDPFFRYTVRTNIDDTDLLVAA